MISNISHEIDLDDSIETVQSKGSDFVLAVMICGPDIDQIPGFQIFFHDRESVERMIDVLQRSLNPYS